MTALNPLDLLTPTDTPLRLVKATVTASTPDVAMLHVREVDGPGYDCIMPITEFIPGKKWAVGETYSLLQLGDPKNSNRDERAILSLTRPELVVRLAYGLCPELRDGRVRIMDIARKAGNRTKIAVASTEVGVDAVAALVGRNANRIKELSRLLQGERVDIIPWHKDQEQYLRNALLPAAISEINFLESEDGPRQAVCKTPSHQMSAAVGKDGLNSLLAGQLTGLAVLVQEA